ncbi:MAG TPA: hypothetical protein VKB53_12800 [Gammaproteobacteria bacterium]|jgi:hypothetical protein|nr:hypothetical protein [Gammaproteobacteria bacterium]HKH21733.1 hypothetical protein [Gammaproteobacteria bacterium]
MPAPTDEVHVRYRSFLRFTLYAAAAYMRLLLAFDYLLQTTST